MFGRTIIGTIAASTLGASSASAFAPSIAKLQGARRVIIISAPGDADAGLKTQQDTQGAADRDVSEVEIVGDRVKGADETAADLRESYGLPKTGFAVIDRQGRPRRRPLEGADRVAQSFADYRRHAVAPCRGTVGELQRRLPPHGSIHAGGAFR